MSYVGKFPKESTMENINGKIPNNANPNNGDIANRMPVILSLLLDFIIFLHNIRQ